MAQKRDLNRRLLPVVVLSLSLLRVDGQQRSWIDYGGGTDSSHYVASKQITKANVQQLAVAWSYPYANLGFNPLIVDRTMYVTGGDALVALDATTGKEIWIHDDLRGITARGINYWASNRGKDRRMTVSNKSYLQEIDATTGKTITTFGKDGAVNLREGFERDPAKITQVQSNSPGKVFQNLVILGSAPGEGYVSPR